ncbi:tyrosine-type recombinase/integrase [Pasteurella multocida]|uniref:tyrosine-type recombinase/integrase n=1 Tax=Pasteurella multocida TaxID=747 RepID=UPI000E8C4742|nr:integrase arm-type DNA-binding domain-containing protein [Pasteurella multocida]MDA5606898.1 integrase arm-type DNA-binding domain-containing protein [Pasteurella multocida subsp. multocida]MDA5614839.1 integrase arm-type DNA-binding domain-containing protein [Pasteurella multocida]MDA5624439.1 integrase arm-type DNA-binding domain-containing protein [Pasteurella multocida]HAS02865.1 integrase [Pasteurella multocida]
MAKKVRPLTDTEIKNAKPKGKEYLLSDGAGLHLMVANTGSKLWRFIYSKPYTNKRAKISIGAYPDLSLSQARAKRDEYNALLANNIDPQTYRKQQAQAQADKLNRTFEKMAKAWFEDRKIKANFSERTAKDTWALFERHLLPHFANYPISEITPLIAINALKPLEKEGKLETVKKTIGNLNNVMRFALHRGLIAHNPLAEIGKEFDKPVSKGMNTITPEALSEFLHGFYRARDENRFNPFSFYAVMLVVLTGGRPSEIAKAKWADIHYKEKTWIYRVQKGNKNLPEGREHVVTLSRQAVGIFNKMQQLHTALGINSEFVFASLTAKSGHLSIEAMRKAIIKGIGEKRLTTHGIRHLFSTSLNEKDYKADWIERALSHKQNKDKNQIRRTYDKSLYLSQRAVMLQEWADYVESQAPELIIPPPKHLKVVA